jgi:photosystem II stability/assembly factor-like uncharacterized protein
MDFRFVFASICGVLFFTTIMKNFYLLLVLTLLWAKTQGQNSWVQSDGPNGGTASCFYLDGENIWVGTAISGPFVSTDKGLTWQSRNRGIGINSTTAYNISSFTRKGSFLFASTLGDGVYRSADNGLNWSRFATGLSGSSLNVSRVLTVGNNLVAITPSGAFVSANDGVTWNNVGATLPSTECLASIEFGGKTYIGYYYSMTGMLYSTDDEGLTWNAVNVPMGSSNWYSTALAAQGNRVYVCVNGRDVFYTENEGQTYTALPAAPGSIGYYARLTFKGDTLFLLQPNDGVYRFNATNNTWVTSSIGLPDVYGRDLFPAGDGRMLYTSLNAGIYRSNTNGNLWSKSDQGFAVTNVYTLANHNNAVYAGTSIYYNTSALTTSTGGYGGDGVYASSNNGKNWEVRNIGIPIISSSAGLVRHLLSANNELLAVADYAGIYKSNDNGATWTQSSGVTSSSTYGVYQSIAAVGNSIFYANYYNPNSGALLRSTDGGQTFQQVTNLPVSGSSYGVYNAGGNNLVYIVYVAPQYKILQSPDGGNTWSEVSTMPSYPYASAFHNGVLYVYSYSGHIFSSNDGGLTWSQSAYISATINDLVGATVNGADYLFAATQSNGIMYSTDAGDSWQEPSADLPTGVASHVKTLLVSNDTLLAGTDGRGVWRLALNEVLGFVTSAPGKAQVESLKAPIFLSPNPAKDFCRLTFDVAQEGVYQVAVYDINGREVLPTETLNLMKGEANLVISTQQLSSGLYVVKAQSPGGIYTARFIVE